ncbi:MAG: 3-isopropylmalate dehydrogenase [Alphaproteobacteria bacterium]|nr:3-isopropylmalate dehydrogenase [Alphaproteobacteria bacterium]
MTKNSHHIAILAGDGIGPEIMAEAQRVITWLNDNADTAVDMTPTPVGGAGIDAAGVPLPDDTLDLCKKTDAILFGSVGGPKWDNVAYDLRPEAGLLELRKKLDLFANLRPAKVYDALIDASTLKPDIVKGLDILIVRELTGGVYFGQPRGIETLPDGQRRGFNTQVYTTHEIERVAEVAFDMARKRAKRVCSAEKANVMESGKLWREEITALHGEKHTDIELTHMYADNCAMQLLRNPAQFDVIVTDNLFGDILSDEAAMLTGSLGMLPSASLGAERKDGTRPALFEPIHGSAPDIAGKGIANPLAMIGSVAMMFRYALNRGDIADKLENAIAAVLDKGYRTADIAEQGAKYISTTDMGNALIATLEDI